MSLKKIFKEPLVHFVLLAILLFVADYIWSLTQNEKIVIDQQTIEYLVKQREDLELRKLSPEERQETIEAFIEDEILYSEAYKRGLDKGDSRMRRNLILKMRGLLIGDIEKPTEQELREYFESHRTDFDYPATVSLNHVFFYDQSKAPEGILKRLRSGVSTENLGDSMPGIGRSLPKMSQRDLVGMLGPEAARAILGIRNDQWHGPFESPRGTHFIRIVAREPARSANYEEVASYLEANWLMFKSRSTIEQEIQRLRDDYEVVIEGDVGGMK